MYNGWLSFLSMCGRVHHDDKPFLLCCLSKREENNATFSVSSNTSIDSMSDPGCSSPSGNG